MAEKTINLTLKVWRQPGPDERGFFVTYEAHDISTDASFLEMLDIVNERLIKKGEEPIAFDHDCREGICGSCGAVVNGQSHGPECGTALCQLHMRKFKDGDSLMIEPFRAKPFKILKDLIVDRTPFDRIQQAGGFISVRTASAPDANGIPVRKEDAVAAFDAATCIGCGACVAACPNASAMLFVSAKVSHFSRMPQGQPERRRRVLAMIEAHDKEGFGNCSNHYECEAACPKEISVENIARLNRDYLRSAITAGKV